MDLKRPTEIYRRVILFVILGVSLVLLLANLGNIYLWQDEAQTALISKTILTEGVPRGYDDKNFFSQEDGAEYGKNYIWRWHTWLPFYVLAGFYKIFGINTFVSRLPFALFGLATIIGTYYFAEQLWPKTKIPLIAAALLGVCVPFLLLCRQCRYYSMVMCFTVLSMWAYTAFLNNKRYASIKLFITSTLLFHSMYFYVPVLFAALFFHACIFRRDKLKFLLLIMAAVIVLNGPWLVWLGPANFSSISEKKALDAAKASEYMRIYIFDIFRYVFPVWLLAVAALAAIVTRLRNGPLLRRDSPFWEKLSLPLLFVIFNCMAMSVAAPGPFFRYIAPSVPLIIILSAVVVNAALDTHLLLGVAVVVLLLITSHLKDYFYEILHDYDGPEEGISLYLNKYGSPEDIVAVNNGDMALKFYTKMRIISGLTGEDLTPVKNARWVILRKNLISHRYLESQNYIRNNISRDKYREIVIDYSDIPFENRENLGDHLFRTSSTKDKVRIWERID